ncbi:hypothetical protein MPSEU_000311100 [Mayamaea pseudoterrestris]|nr:hypothetical protein MPSEU_000311100 [Mayamaea pseudoterrestris]
MADSKLLFPKEDLTVLGATGTITFTEALLFDQELIRNARAIQSSYGNGLAGHAHLVLPPVEYAVRSGGVAYVPQAFPGPDPEPQVGANGGNPTAAQVSEAARVHLVRTNIFNKNILTATALMAQVTKAIPSVYLQALEDPITGMENVSILQVRQHIKDEYGTATPQLIEANYAQASEPFNLDESIETYTGKMERIRRLAAATNDPMTDAALIRFAVAAMTATSQFCQDLHTRSIEQQIPNQPAETWENFVAWLKRVDKARRIEKTATDAGFQAQANHAATIAAAVQEHNRAHPPHQPAAAATGSSNAPRIKKYCHTHGHCGHTSKDCNRRAPGHQENATKNNKMGGNEATYAPRRNRGRNTTDE